MWMTYESVNCKLLDKGVELKSDNRVQQEQEKNEKRVNQRIKICHEKHRQAPQ